MVHYPDVEDGADVPEPVRRGSQNHGLQVRHLRADAVGGAGDRRDLGRPRHVGEFSEKEIALLKTFADQAVIAIQNAKLFHEIQEKSHQLEIANQHKSAFLANMSHELRTPLNAVIGFSEMLAARYFGELTDKQAEYVNDIHGSGKHLLSLINDILDLSKIEAGRMELEAAEFDLRAALDNALTLVRERAQRSGIALRLEADPALGAFHGDERKVKQVVLNLLSNAVKFTPRGRRGGRRRAAGERQCGDRRHRHRRGHRARGPGGDLRGVPAGRHRRHAQARGHRPRPRPHAPLRRAARRYDSRRERARQGLDLHRHAADPPWRMSSILIVEDNEQNRKLARDLLQVHGYRTIEAETGEDGVALAGERAPDLVVMDIHLPGISGIEALAQLRAAPATRAIPVIAFTASVMPQDRNDIIAAGFDAFVSKPINIETFLGGGRGGAREARTGARRDRGADPGRRRHAGERQAARRPALGQRLRRDRRGLGHRGTRARRAPTRRTSCCST